MQLFRRAFTSRICDRRLFHPSLYIPGTVFTIPSLFQLPLPLRNGRPTLTDLPLSREEPPSTPPPPRTKEEIFLHIRWGVIVRHNVTNFQLLRGCVPPPSSSNVARSLERAFKSTTNPSLFSPTGLPSFRILKDQPSRWVGMMGCGGFHLFLHEAWSTATTVQGPIFPTHNLQFHILFPSRVRQLVDGGG